MYYTYDEWGRSVLHIVTGAEGIKIFKKAFGDDKLSPEEYEKHIESHNRREKERLDIIMEQIGKMLGKWK